MLSKVLAFLKPEEDSLIGTTLFAFLLWAFAGSFAGAASAPFFGMMETWQMPVTIGMVIGLAVGLAPAFRGKVGIPLTATLLSLLGWFVGLIFRNWQLGATATIVGGIVGIAVGIHMQERFTRNESRSTSASGFYI